MSRKVIAKAARYLDDKECQRPANVSCGSGRQGTLPRKVCRVPSVALTHCWHGMLQLKARQFRAWWRRMNGRGPVSRHLQLPARRGLKHAHALESELSMLTGGVSYCRFSFHGGVKHVHPWSRSRWAMESLPRAFQPASATPQPTPTRHCSASARHWTHTGQPGHQLRRRSPARMRGPPPVR